MTVIRTKDLAKTFEVKVKNREKGQKNSAAAWRKIPAVQKVSFEVEEGESLAFLGPNGAGKSTTIKILSGILFPDSGEAEVLGLVPWKDRKKLAYEIGSVFGQKSQLWYHLPALDSFELLAAIYEIPKTLYKKRRDELIEAFDLKTLLDIPVRKLSLGQRIRCEIAASLLHEPKVLFLDEPTIGLDVVVKEEIRKLLLNWNREKKLTLFLTSHDLGDVEKLCRRAVLIHHGQLLMDESLHYLKQQAGRYKILSLRYASASLQAYENALKALQSFPGSGLKNAEGRPCLELLEQRENRLRLSLDSHFVDPEALLRFLMDKGELEDFTLEDEALEKLIGDLYRSKSPEEAYERLGK